MCLANRRIEGLEDLAGYADRIGQVFDWFRAKGMSWGANSHRLTAALEKHEYAHTIARGLPLGN